MYFACGRKPRKQSEPNLAIGDRVCRKSNRAIIGEVNYLPDDEKTARVLWASRVSGRQRPIMTFISIASLIKVEGGAK